MTPRDAMTATEQAEPNTAAGAFRDAIGDILADPDHVQCREMGIGTEAYCIAEGLFHRGYTARQQDSSALRSDKCWVHHDETCTECPRFWMHSAALPPSAPPAVDVERLAKALDVLSEDGLEYDLMSPEEREDRDDAAEHLAAEYARLQEQERPRDFGQQWDKAGPDDPANRLMVDR